jgi:bis(5'-nucleosyl)-tetraphosphatase (symmetrical)
MATYAIGDIQGCFEPLQRLLEKIQFDPKKDRLWFTGDLVNRGPHSLETLRFIKSLDSQIITVLGNHDLTLLAVGFGVIPYQPQHHTFSDILEAEDRDELLNWLRYQPLIHKEDSLGPGYTLVHAGLHPDWDLATALALANEVECMLQGPQFLEFFAHMYGNKPDIWDPKLTGWDRLRFIVNCFTRLRFCSPEGQIDLTTKDTIHPVAGYYPWFALKGLWNHQSNIIFGHWASLGGQCHTPKVFALDTGCVWGNTLTAMCLENEKYFRVPCQKMTNTQI